MNMYDKSDSLELFIPADLRPEPRPFLQARAPLDPDASNTEIQRQAQLVLGEWQRAGLMESRDRSLTNRIRSVYERNADVVWVVLDGECVLVHLETTECFSLSSAAAEFWRLCDGQRRTEDIVTELCNTFDVADHVLRDDMQALVARLLQQGLVRERTT